jgi:hypothetical protein
LVGSRLFGCVGPVRMFALHLSKFFGLSRAVFLVVWGQYVVLMTVLCFCFGLGLSRANLLIPLQNQRRSKLFGLSRAVVWAF